MEKEEILNISRKENKNKDLADLELSTRAGNIAGRVGASVCCVISCIFYWVTDTLLLSPWIICFSIFGTHYLVKYINMKNKTDLVLTILYYAICVLAFVFFVVRLVEAKNE